MMGWRPSARVRLRLARVSVRVDGVYLSIMTQALSYALMLAFFGTTWVGGNNGFSVFKEILASDLQRDSTRIALLLVTSPRSRELCGFAFIVASPLVA